MRFSLSGITIIPFMTLALLSSCATEQKIPLQPATQTLNNNQVSHLTIRGTVEFPAKFATKAGLTDIATYATVSVIYPPDHATKANQTIASGLTDDAGFFTINPSFNFLPAQDEIFVLEALKRIGSSANSFISIRTYLQWNGTSWDSMTAPYLKINKKTAALALIDFYDASISPADTIGTIDTSSGSSVPGNVGSVNSTTINLVAGMITNIMNEDLDPFQFITYDNGEYIYRTEKNPKRGILLASNACTGCDLTAVDLSNQTLTNANLVNANLSSSNLSNTNLSGADLSGVNLSGSNLSGANLSGAVLNGANLNGADLSGCILTGANLSNSSLISVSFQNASLSGASLTGASYIGADFSGAIFTDGFNCLSDPFRLGVCRRGEFMTHTNTVGEQTQPSIAMDNDGDFVVVWDNIHYAQLGNDAIFAQRYNRDGTKAGSEFIVNTYTTDKQSNSDVAMDSDGDFVVVWESRQDGSIYGIYGQRYDSSGNPVGSEFLVNSYTTSNQRYPAVAMDDNGDFVVTWTSFQDGSYYGIYGQRYDSSGNPAGSEFKVNTHTTGNQKNPDVAMDSDGDFVITWTSANQDGAPYETLYGVYAQRYDSSGNAIIPSGCGTTLPYCNATTGEFLVNTSYTTGSQTEPAVAMDDSGSFIISWISAPSGFSFGIYAQRYDSNALPVGNEISVTPFPFNARVSPAVAMDSDGDFIIAWQSAGQDGSNYGVFARRYDSQGNKVKDEFQVNTFTDKYQSKAAVAMDNNGDFIVSWQSGDYGSYYSQDGVGYGIYSQRYDKLGTEL